MCVCVYVCVWCGVMCVVYLEEGLYVECMCLCVHELGWYVFWCMAIHRIVSTQKVVNIQGRFYLYKSTTMKEDKCPHKKYTMC